MIICVFAILKMLAENGSIKKILADFSDLEITDIQACLLLVDQKINITKLIT